MSQSLRSPFTASQTPSVTTPPRSSAPWETPSSPLQAPTRQLETSASLLGLYKNGTRATLMISLPILVTLIVRGPSFNGLWMGKQYTESSGTVLIILVSALFFSFANRTAASIAFGIEKHKTAAIWSIGEGVANLALSITLAHWYGIYGVAIGTLIPSLIVQVGLWPSHISKLVGLSGFEVVWRIWTPMFLSSVHSPSSPISLTFISPARNLAIFFLQVLAHTTYLFHHGSTYLSNLCSQPGLT